MLGANPIVVDASNSSQLPDVDSYITHVTSKTKAIIPVYLNGYSLDIDKLLEFSRKNNIFVVGDAAQALYKV